MTTGQRSPDGRFWWDGTGWRPVQPSPPFPFQHAPSPAPSPPRPPRRRALLLPLAGVVIAALVLGGVLGGAVGLLTTEVRASTAAPAFADDFPDVGDQYLPGVTLTLIVDEWMKKANSWTCANRPGNPDTWSMAKQHMRCQPKGDDGRRYVDIEYDAADRIRVVRATCHLGTYEDACTTVFATMADAALVPQPKLRERARSWAQKNAASERATIIGGLRLQASLSPHALRITPES
ncbi:hypothetical protein ABGB14_38250 [Nonomuraea sp. B10E15]|uniref:hypothetical protein n=1 Tax=Nonomuraea sp. B10E15 TaxID=3153560 RepID=UPI00325EC0A3